LREPLPLPFPSHVYSFSVFSLPTPAEPRIVVSVDTVHLNFFSGVYPIASPAGFEESAHRRNGWHSGTFNAGQYLRVRVRSVQKPVLQKSR
jgi:hypothetical protein